MKIFRYTFMALLAAGATSYAGAGEPTEQIRTSTDTILAVLHNPDLKPESRKLERRELIRREIEQRVDWATIARSSLGRHWSQRTHSEQVEFVSLFSQMLKETAIEKFESNYGELERIDYVGEKRIDEYASVKAQVTTKNQILHPVEFRLQKSGTDWRIYDVMLEGVSLVKNYRDQFDELLAKSSYQKLLAEIQAKIPPGSP